MAKSKAKLMDTYGVELSPFEAYKNAQNTFEGLTEVNEKLCDIITAIRWETYPDMFCYEKTEKIEGKPVHILELLEMSKRVIEGELTIQQNEAKIQAKKGKLI